jgi:hypothetical protein
MTTETVNLHRRISVTTLAELVLGIDRQKLSLCALVGMTINTTRQTVLWRTDALVHRPVALVFQKVKMIPTHNFNWLNALGTPSLGQHRLADLCQRARQTRANRQG